ncbi:MAG: hypothetical protein RBU37_10500 [Myxococcota bacterium]|nr:hypothetical protein [Myxococcota bacterium]
MSRAIPGTHPSGCLRSESPPPGFDFLVIGHLTRSPKFLVIGHLTRSPKFLVIGHLTRSPKFLVIGHLAFGLFLQVLEPCPSELAQAS